MAAELSSQDSEHDDGETKSSENAAEAIHSHHRPSEIFSAEDIANSVSHGVGLGMSIAGLALLVVVAAINGDTVHVVSAAIYGATLVILFGASTVYHSMTRPAARRILRVVDHSAIYLLIAGTYTPFTLVTLSGTLGWALFSTVWAMALIGVLYKIFWFGRLKALSMGLYLVMGWSIVLAIKPLLESLHIGGIVLVIVGGLLYTVGVIFYAWEKLFFNHAIWHFFVLAAAVCHYLAILLYVMM